MRTYTTAKPRMYWDDDWPLLPDFNVFERDASPKDTGLLDASGNKLYAIIKRDQIGFIRKPED